MLFAFVIRSIAVATSSSDQQIVQPVYRFELDVGMPSSRIYHPTIRVCVNKQQHNTENKCTRVAAGGGGSAKLWEYVRVG